jgi:alginate O-acetyltransferase complex protein AlgI
VSLFPLIVVVLISLIIGRFAQDKWRSWSLMIGSLLAIYWFQPSVPIRHLDFWLPTVCIVMTVLIWVFTRAGAPIDGHRNLITGLVISGVILAIGLTRYLGPVCCLTPSLPPSIIQIFLVVFLVISVSLIFLRFSKGYAGWIYASIIIILGLFVILKSDPLATTASRILRSMSSQSVQLASPFDIRWLGFSYLSFRLLHTLRDRISGRLPDVTLQEFVIYIIFFPALTAGPIDRIQRFIQDLRQPYRSSTSSILIGIKRIVIGIFSKFVLADGLALFALSSTSAAQVTSVGWLWVMLYAFALRIFFDFSGYTDIAIGMGQLLGINLPENFERPYLKQNLTLFWNSWHITLAQWFRAYFFNPLTRLLRSSQKALPAPLIIFVGQLSTFILIGLWHGINWNFAIWGAWQGFGLFIHNRWSDLIRRKDFDFTGHPSLNRLVNLSSTFLTFNYVALGWVWFTLATPAQSWNTLLKLFGLS